MNGDDTIELLLRWRLAHGESHAPPAPRATRLLEAVRPWWEVWPERFQAAVARLSSLPYAYGHAMTELRQGASGQPLPAVILRREGEIEVAARILYLDVRKSCLRLRFELDAPPVMSPAGFEVTFVPEAHAASRFVAGAVQAAGNEYRLETHLEEGTFREWQKLKVTDPIPYRLILRPGEASE